MSNKFIFVGVVYNDYKNTFYFCQSLAEMIREADVRCVLVDNSDDSEVSLAIDSLAEKFTFVSILRPQSNLGYFGAFNFFFDSNLFDKSSTVVLCNNDLIFKSDFCSTYSSSSYPEDAWVICPDVITEDGIHQNPHVLEPMSLLWRLKMDIYFSCYFVARAASKFQFLLGEIFGNRLRRQPSKPGYLHMGIGACYILCDRFIERIDSLDYPHFLYGEEAYLSRQVHRLGARLFYDPQLKVFHKESATLSRLPSRLTYEYGREGYWEYRRYL